MVVEGKGSTGPAVSSTVDAGRSDATPVRQTTDEVPVSGRPDGGEQGAEVGASVTSLLRFAGMLLDAFDFENDIDGSEFQDIASHCGMMTPVTMTAPCDPECCRCAEVDDFPLTCFRYTELAKSALRFA